MKTYILLLGFLLTIVYTMNNPSYAAGYVEDGIYYSDGELENADGYDEFYYDYDECAEGCGVVPQEEPTPQSDDSNDSTPGNDESVNNEQVVPQESDDSNDSTPGNDESVNNEQVVPQPIPQSDDSNDSTPGNDESVNNEQVVPQEPIPQNDDSNGSTPGSNNSANYEIVTENNNAEPTSSFSGSFQPVVKVDVEAQSGVVTIIDISANYDSKAQLTLVTLANSQVADNKDGTLTYISNRSFKGYDQFEYTLLYENGNTFTFKVTVKVMLIEEEPMPAQCSIYAVHDDGFSDSQLLVIEPNQEYSTVALGPLYKKLNIESLEIHPISKQLYAISSIGRRGSNAFDGYLYEVNPQTGDLIAVGDTGFSNITALAFHQDGTLWAWSNKGAKDSSEKKGIIEIDPETAKSSLVFSALELFGKKSQIKKIDSLAWNSEGTILYAGEKNNNLWAYDDEKFEKKCNLPGQAEALETLKDGMLLFTLHNGAGDLLSVHYDPESCEVVDTPLMKIDGYHDIESLAWSLDCQNTVEDILALQLAKILGADNVRLEKDGTLFVELGGLVHQALLTGELTQIEMPEISSLAPVGDMNSDGYDDFEITYSDGQAQKVFYLGVAQ